jgi:hypothetical protein
MSKKKNENILNKIFIHLNDLTKEELTAIPKKADTLYEITEDIMNHGAYIYKGDTCYYIPPESIVKIEYQKGKCPDCDGKEPCDNCDEEDEDDA